ncbi:hypothetical protein YC2023_058763 [Brassica napus]
MRIRLCKDPFHLDVGELAFIGFLLSNTVQQVAYVDSRNQITSIYLFQERPTDCKGQTTGLATASSSSKPEHQQGTSSSHTHVAFESII